MGNSSQNESETLLTYAMPPGFQEKTIHVQHSHNYKPYNW